MKRGIALAGFFLLCGLFIPTFAVKAVDRGCNITSFTLSPNNTTVNLGDVIALDGKSTCGTVRFEIDQEPKSEIGSTDLSMNMNTAEFGAGTHDVCFVARGEGGWPNADRRCVKITVKENQPQCQITSFSYSPRKDVYTLGDEINFDGKSTCGTTRYTVEGKIVSELGSTDLSYQFKTGEWGKETYTVCFVAHGEGGWEKAVSKCGTIFVGTDPGLPPVYPDDKEPEPEGGDNCVVKSLSVTPQSANPGDTIQLKGTGECDGGPRAVKFTVDGQAKGELGAPTLETTWNTSGYSNGTHKVCFLVVKSDWSKAASRCVNVTLGKAAQAPVPVGNCKGDHMTLEKDLTIPDGTKVLPGQVFVKSWRIKNDGNCVWNKNYYFTSLGGEKMEGKVNNIPGTVSPGETIDISLELHAPTEPGTYKSYWGIIDPKENQLKNRVFVLIEVVNSIQPGEKPGEDVPGEKRSLDILGYCQSRGYTGAYANDKDNARSWVCEKPGDLTFVNFDDACKFTNGDEFGKAVVQNEQNPNSWYCEKDDKETIPLPNEPVIASLEINQLDIIDNGQSYNCGKQCVKLIREEFPASKENSKNNWWGWGVLNKETPSEWFSELKEYRGKDYPGDGTGTFFYVRGESEKPMPGDIIVWNAGCEDAVDAGHTGIVASFEPNRPKDKDGVQRPLRVNDYNWGEDHLCWKNNPRKYNPSCTLFLMPYSPSITDAKESKNDNNQDQDKVPQITQPALEPEIKSNPIQGWLCEKFGWFCKK